MSMLKWFYAAYQRELKKANERKRKATSKIIRKSREISEEQKRTYKKEIK